MAHRTGIIGEERPGKQTISKKVRVKEIATFPFLLPSSINGPPSPSIFQYSRPKSVVGMDRPLDNTNMRAFRLSATSQAFTPASTRPPTPTIADNEIIKQLQQQLTDSVCYMNIVSDQLHSCQMQLQAKTGENAHLRNYVNSLQAQLNDKLQKQLQVTGVTSSAPVPPMATTSTKTNTTTDFDKKIKEEFGMLFREIHNFGMNYYQFPTDASIEGELRITLKDIIGSEKVIFELLNDVRTKLIVIATVVTRLLFTQIFRGGFSQKIIVALGLKVGLGMRNVHEYFEGQKEAVSKAISENAHEIAGKIHLFLRPLMSRPGDTKHKEDSIRHLEELVEHASRIWIKITSLGHLNWRFLFHPQGTRFTNAGMVPGDARNLGFMGEQKRNNQALEAEGRKILFCVFPMVEKFVVSQEGIGEWTVLVKASTRLD